MDIMKPQARVLLYNLQDGERAKKVRRYLAQAGVQITDVYPAEYRQKLGALLDMPGFKKTEEPYIGSGFPEEMLVMFAFDDDMMEAFFQFFRNEGMPTVGLKAAVTPTNINWTSLELYEAISKEHAMMQTK